MSHTGSRGAKPHTSRFASIGEAQQFSIDNRLTSTADIARFLTEKYEKPISRNRVEQILKRAMEKIRVRAPELSEYFQ